MRDKVLLEQLLAVYEKHGKIIVGVDFDDTVFPFNKNEANAKRCNEVVKLLKKLKDRGMAIICLFSVADAQSLVYKEHIMDLYGIKPDYINESPMQNWGKCTKPYFNIQLDDKAGLNATLATITEFYQVQDEGFMKQLK